MGDDLGPERKGECGSLSFYSCARHLQKKKKKNKKDVKERCEGRRVGDGRVPKHFRP